MLTVCFNYMNVKWIEMDRNVSNLNGEILNFQCMVKYFIIELGRFQNSSVPVLNFKQHTVPVLTGSIANVNFGTGSRGFGSSVLTVLTFWLKSAKMFTIFELLWMLPVKRRQFFALIWNLLRFFSIILISKVIFAGFA